MRWLWRWRSTEHWPDPPERLIDVPASRDPSPDVLRRLRGIDPQAEVIYIGGGRWWLGRVKPNSPRRAVGRRMALAIREGDGFPWESQGASRWPELRQALLMAQGFGLLAEVSVQGEPDGALVAALERAVSERRQPVEPDPEELERQAAAAERRTRERELLSWLYRRSPYGRANPWIGWTPTRSTT
jgi:hypothetical protein